MNPNPTVYIAAAAYNSREAQFNTNLSNRLSCCTGCDIILPQKEGFVGPELANAFLGKLSEDEAGHALRTIAYCQNFGYLMPQADMVIANLDEPIDAGVVMEMSYGKRIGKKIIGFRTDIRPPCGAGKDSAGKYSIMGMHAFPVYQCDIFITQPANPRNRGNGEQEMESLAHRLREAIIELKPGITKDIPQNALLDSDISGLLNGAELLFNRVERYNFPPPAETLVQRYLDNRAELDRLTPRIMHWQTE